MPRPHAVWHIQDLHVQDSTQENISAALVTSSVLLLTRQEASRRNNSKGWTAGVLRQQTSSIPTPSVCRMQQQGFLRLQDTSHAIGLLLHLQSACAPGCKQPAQLLQAAATATHQTANTSCDFLCVLCRAALAWCWWWWLPPFGQVRCWHLTHTHMRQHLHTHDITAPARQDTGQVGYCLSQAGGCCVAKASLCPCKLSTKSRYRLSTKTCSSPSAW